MKKYLIPTLASLLALAACSKVAPVNETAQREISFQVANYVQTKATTGVKYYEDGTFGTYAWFNAADPFMVNEEVGLSGGVWKTLKNTFYWPKTGSIDFISFSPYAAKPEVKLTDGTYSMTFGDYTVIPEQAAAQSNDATAAAAVSAYSLDLMYADLATASENKDDIQDNGIQGSSDSGYKGVPTLFRHALAKVSFSIQANFLEVTATNADQSTSKTTWEITLNKAQLQGYKNQGTLTLTWDKTDGKWDGSWMAGENAEDQTLVLKENLQLTTSPQDLKTDLFMLPQVFADRAQQLALDFTIKTTLANGNVINESYSTAIDLKTITNEWKMNQITNYIIKIKPTASDDTNPRPDTPEDVVITFDPAVVDWNSADADLTLQI